jgi:hypothetical protein
MSDTDDTNANNFDKDGSNGPFGEIDEKRNRAVQISIPYSKASLLREMMVKEAAESLIRYAKMRIYRRSNEYLKHETTKNSRIQAVALGNRLEQEFMLDMYQTAMEIVQAIDSGMAKHGETPERDSMDRILETVENVVKIEDTFLETVNAQSTESMDEVFYSVLSSCEHDLVSYVS